MPFVGDIVGAYIGAEATEDASNIQAGAANRATDLQGRVFDTTNEQQRPYREAGYAALSDLLGMRNTDPTPNAAAVMGEPGYQFGLDQGRRWLESGGAARTNSLGGDAIRAGIKFNSDYAGTRYNDAFNRAQTSFGNRWGRLASLAGIGQTATSQSQQAGQNYANNAGNIGMANANAQAAGTIARGNIYGNAVNSLVSYGGRNNWWGNTPSEPNWNGWGGGQDDPWYG
jgi:hypothetical protein